jgi:hypothetical protein
MSELEPLPADAMRLPPGDDQEKVWTPPTDLKLAVAEHFSSLQRLVDEQAADEALWFITENISEAYLQQELRRLHAAIETALKGEASPNGH